MATSVETPTRPAVPDAPPPRRKKEPVAQKAGTEEDTESREDSSSSAAAKGRALDPKTSRTLLLILHGKRVDDDLLRDAITELKKQGHKILVRVTFDSGDVDRFVTEAVKLNRQGITNYQTIVAGGGDGTLNEVVCSLMKHREAVQQQGIAVALLPLGTANDFACVSGVSVDPYAALQLALDPATLHSIDVAAVNGRPFMNIAVAGSVAESSAEELNSKWKRIFGPAAIGIHVLQRMLKPRSLEPHQQVKITFSSEPGASPPSATQEDSPQPNQSKTQHSSKTDMYDSDSYDSSKVRTLTADLLMLAAGNSRQMGRRVNVCPDAVLDDGLLDFTVLTGKSLTGEAAGLLSTLASGGSDRVTCEQGIAQLKASWLEVKAPEGSNDLIPVNRDGEPEDASSRLLFEVYPRALLFHLPDDRMLQQGQQLETATSTGSVISVSDIRGNIFSGDAATEAPAGSGAGGSADHHLDKKGKKSKHRKLRKRTLRRMVVAVQPEGREVRQSAQLAKTRKQLGKWVIILVIGGGLGWLAAARRGRKGEEKEQQVFVQDGHVPAADGHSNQQQMHSRFDDLTAKAKFEKRRLAVPTV